GEALLLFGLFATQLLIPDPRFRYYYSFIYIVLAIGLVAFRRTAREAVTRLFVRDSDPRTVTKD
ncbi:MAG TPA: hypothetical protein VE131_00705, partial [Terriglobales bacterium]|nr:hypothetical protein [Terriglobales bacterium]